MLIFRTLLLAVVFVLSLTSCARNDEKVATKTATEDTASSSKQYFCMFAGVYRKDVDGCVIPFFDETLPVQPTLTVKIAKIKVVDVAIAKPGDGLISVTRWSMMPLSAEEAASLAREYGRYIQKYKGPKLYIGEKIFLLETDVMGQKIRAWKIESGDRRNKNK